MWQGLWPGARWVQVRCSSSGCVVTRSERHWASWRPWTGAQWETNASEAWVQSPTTCWDWSWMQRERVGFVVNYTFFFQLHSKTNLYVIFRYIYCLVFFLACSPTTSSSGCVLCSTCPSLWYGDTGIQGTNQQVCPPLFSPPPQVTQPPLLWF